VDLSNCCRQSRRNSFAGRNSLAIVRENAVDVAWGFQVVWVVWVVGGGGLAGATIGEIRVKSAAHTLEAKDKQLGQRCKPAGINKKYVAFRQRERKTETDFHREGGKKSLALGKRENPSPQK